jgi:hypothetical protein
MGHVYVGDEEARPVLPYGVEGGPAVRGDRDVIAETPHHLGDDTLMIKVVLRDDYACHTESINTDKTRYYKSEVNLSPE